MKLRLLFDSQVYLKNPNAPESLASRQQSMILDGIARVANGQSVSGNSSSATATNTSVESGSKTSNGRHNSVSVSVSLLVSGAGK
jgi:hypothetical protein